MDIKIADISAQVAIRLGEWADRRAWIRDGSAYHLDAIVEELLPLTAVEMVRSCENPALLADCVKDCSETLARTTDFGEGEAAVGELPDDFLLPVSFRLSGWCRYDILPPGGDMMPQRVRLFPAAGKRIIEATYIPRPYLDSGWLCDFPERLLEGLAERLADVISRDK